MDTSLAEMEQGHDGVVVELVGGHEFQRKLRSLGIREGKSLLVKARHPFGGPLVVEIDGRQSTIGRGMAAQITLRVTEEG